MKYVYTEKGEARAKELGFDDRRAGEIACCGHKEVSGLIASAWVAKGYIREVEDDADGV